MTRQQLDTTSDDSHSPSTAYIPTRDCRDDLGTSSPNGVPHNQLQTASIRQGDTPGAPIPIESDNSDREENREANNGRQTSTENKEVSAIVDGSGNERQSCLSLPLACARPNKRRSSFLKTALGSLDRISNLRRRSKPVVEQPDSKQPAKKRKFDSDSPPNQRPAAEQRRKKKIKRKQSSVSLVKPKQTDEERKAGLELNPLILARALENYREEHLGNRQHFDEWVELMQAAAEPNVNTRDLECEVQESSSTAVLAITSQEESSRTSTLSSDKPYAASPRHS